MHLLSGSYRQSTLMRMTLAKADVETALTTLCQSRYLETTALQ
jgi:hypothetical protein